MTEQHTPGPWHWVIHDSSMATLQGQGEWDHVASIGPCEACQARADPDEWKWGRCTTPREANARLIAAAPDLLDALLAVAAVADRKTHGFNLARAAIAKAFGQKP